MVSEKYCIWHQPKDTSQWHRIKRHRTRIWRSLPEAAMKTNPPEGHPKPTRADVPGTRPTRARAQGLLLFELWAPTAAPHSLAPSWVERTAISREMQMTASRTMRRSGKRPQINTCLWERTWKKRNLCTTMTNTQKLPSQKALSIFMWAQLPVRDFETAKTKLRTILSSLFTNHLVWGEGAWGKVELCFPFSSFSKRNSNIPGEEKGRVEWGRDPGKKGFLRFIWKTPR